MFVKHVLRIECKSVHFDTVDRILNTHRSNNDDLYWELIIIDDDTNSSPPIYYIDAFLPLLQGKYQALEEIGISREEITIWKYYEYDEQCNLEFHPNEMKQLADNGIVLCVSCWQAGGRSILGSIKRSMNQEFQ
jgi:hypothetical protein